MSISRISLAIAVLVVGLFGFVLSSQASVINMTADDAVGTTSFNTAGHWSDSNAPAAANDYTNLNSPTTPVRGQLLRTPSSAGNFSFAGNSLTITGVAAVVTPANQAIIWKGTGGSAATPNVITVNNLTLNPNGFIRHGSGSADFFALAGNLLINGGIIDAQGPTYIQSLVSGSATVIIDSPGNTDVARTVHFTNGANTYTGSINLTEQNDGLGTNVPRFELDSTGVLNFVIGANGVNNSVFTTLTGIATYDGAFNFNLAGADNTPGDIWSVAAATTQTFTGTFTVTGFNNDGGGIWDEVANGVDYQFSQTTGQLTVVPEPSALLLAGLSLVGLIGAARRRK
ncbi:MAG TPA: PEP-CTERM sorting domain-containing protein [Pirellulales bacterium]|jgi:hypothetical protein|nr:PEP-CTERM sorting domain-containing protein [Pirellulales bacterium]